MTDVIRGRIVADPSAAQPTQPTRNPTAPARAARLATLTSGLFVVAVLAASKAAPFRPAALSGDPLERPSTRHLLGTNLAGQDLLSHLLHGARSSIAVALAAATLAVSFGGPVGAATGWFDGFVPVVLGRATDLAMVIPRLPLLILLGGYAGTSVTSTAIVIAAVSWAGARAVRARVEIVRARGYVRAARGFGASTLHVARRHLLPAVTPLAAASFVSIASRSVVLEAGLAFLGIGDLTRVSWGSTMREALEFGSLFRTSAWQWWLLPPVVATTALTLLLARVATVLDLASNPRLRAAGGPGR